MGAIIFWTILRTALVLTSLMFLYDFVNYGLWISIAITSGYGIIIHPAVIQYELFKEKNKEIIHDTLCSSCANFDKTAVLCLKYDEHPTTQNLPCGGVDWELNELNEKDYSG